MTIDTPLARAVRAAVADGANSDDFGAIPVPGTYVGAYLRAEDAETIGKLPSAEKRRRWPSGSARCRLPSWRPMRC